MTARCPTGSSGREQSCVTISRKAPKPKPIKYSIYLGRERLGRSVQINRKRFFAFDARDRPLENFRIRARALAAIRKAWARLA